MRQGFIFACLTALCWGLAPVFAKLGLPRVSAANGVFVRAMAVSAGIIMAVLFSGSFKSLGALNAKTVALLCAEGLLAGLVGQWLYFKAIKAWETSHVVPIVASYPLISFIIGIIFLNEAMTTQKVFGVVLVILGVVFLR